ncbi:MAG TPA: hypothetical protein VGM16_00040 [Gammaproteobacteria bacterium]|jgi:hypothetical protein
MLIRVASYLLGGGVRLFDAPPEGVQLETLSITDGPYATHIRYKVLKGKPGAPLMDMK